MFTSRKYQPVSQKVESDSEDDEVTLYTSSKNNTDGHFGLGSYDESRDLDLPPPLKMKQKHPTMSKLQAVCCALIFAVVLAMVLAIAIAAIAIGQTMTINDTTYTSSNTLDYSDCTPIPTPVFKTTTSHSTLNTEDLATIITESSTSATADGLETTQPTTSENDLTLSTTATTPTTATSTVEAEELTTATSTVEAEELSTATSTIQVEEHTSVPQPIDSNTTPVGSNNNLPSITTEALYSDTFTDRQTEKGTTSAPPTPNSTTLPFIDPTKSSQSSFYWEREFFPAVTESSIQISDMNRDGTPDVITVESFSGCMVHVHALDGMSGDTIWEVDVNFEVFAVRCDIDVNKDGVDDCLLSGRNGGFGAVDGVNGSIVWEVDKSIVYPRYNFYFPLIVRDLDSDKVEDLINIHGGDVSYGPDEVNRSPASLVAVSGATGQSLMDPIQLPDGHESYMSPVLFKLNGKLELVLFGTGGETIPGSLWAISLSSIKNRIFRKQTYRKVMKESYIPFKNDTYHPCFLDSGKLDEMRPVYDKTLVDFSRPHITSKTEGYCATWSKVIPIWNKHDVCLYRLMSSDKKGIMLPPVIVDLNNDGVKDLVVSTFDGHTVALDGTDGYTKLWDAYYPNTETYSLPAPILYTDDIIPDLLIRTSLGEWSQYNSSTIRILNGSDGTELWSLKSVHTSMMSPLSLASYSPGLDAMLFISVGTFPTKPESVGTTTDTSLNTPPPHDSNTTLPYEFIDTDDTVPYFNSTNDSDEEILTRENRVERHSHNTNNDDLGSDSQDKNAPDYKKMFEEFRDDVGEAKEVGEDEGDNIFEDDDDDEMSQKPHNSMDYEDDFIQRVLNIKVPPNLWISTPEDPFPDPNTDMAGFLEYCGESIERLTANVWFATKDMILGEVELKPLAAHKPYVFMRPTTNETSPKTKRHGPGADNLNDDFTKIPLKNIRCAHISAPVMSYTSPAMGDFNQDGRLDFAYSVAWGPMGSLMMVPPKFKVYVFTLEERFKEVYGSDLVVDFNGFVPSEEQPWSRYMGTLGDNVYTSRTFK